METFQPTLIPNPMSGPPSSAPPPPPLHRDEEEPDSSVSQSNLDALLTAINSNTETSQTDNTFVVDSQPSNAMSIQSLLAGSESSAQHQLQNNHGKRKYDEVDDNDTRAKIRKTVRDHLVMDHSRIMSMTTVVCLHAAVAQKSYGSEKRFLCPPPIVRIEGPNQQLRSQQLTMRIVSEDGRHSPPQKATLDTSMQAAFKHLHVGGSPKQKNFHLTLDIATVPPPTEENREPPGRVWASFESAPVTIISKPSKKTAKTRNISSCILPGGPVSLFNRINSQTVRTKYMIIDHASLCASNTSWSAFNVNVVYRPPEPQSHLTGPQTVTYGSQIVLTDTLSGISTGSLIIRKVDKGIVTLEDGGPVSQMQKIALQRITPDGSRQYLSAAGTINTTGSSTQQMPAASQSGTHALSFQAPRSREEVKDGIRRVVDEVDDYLCWTIVGISKFQYTFFDALHKIPWTPKIPLTPFPTLFTPPIYRQSANTLELTVSNFYTKSMDSSELQPLEVWLGSVGPLKQRVYQSNASGPLTSIANFQPQASQPDTGGSGSPRSPVDSNPSQSVASPITPSHTGSVSGTLQSSASNLGPLHSIVVVEMPKVEMVISAILEILQPENSTSSKVRHSTSDNNGNGTADITGSHGDEHSNIRSQGRRTSVSGMRSPVVMTQKTSSSVSSVNGRSLPILFVRPSDGMGYHSGRSIVCENIFQNMSFNSATGNGTSSSAGAAATSGSGNVDPGWIANAQQALSGEGGYTPVWSLRVL